MLNRFHIFFKLRDEKSKIVFKNVTYSFLLKGINIATVFLTIPLVLSFLDTTQYGIWLTLTAVFGWFSLFDLGFGNGLRNKLAATLSDDNNYEARVYVSTTYLALITIFGFLLIVFFIINPFISWSSVFNAPVNIKEDLKGAITYSVSFLFVQFVLRLINTVLLAFQRSAMADFANTLVQVCILIGLYILKVFHYKSLTAISVVYSIIPVIVFLSFSLMLFGKTYRHLRPSLSFVKIEYVKNLLNIGLNFFVIQIAALVLYASDNFIISQYFDPSHVTTYNIAFKYFSLVNIIFTIVLAPFWSMTSKSYAEGDLVWIRKTVKRLLVLWLLLFTCGILQLVISNYVYEYWTGSIVFVPLSLSAVMCMYFFIMNWGVIFGNFLNGVGKVKMQLYFSVAGMILNIPLAVIFIKVFHFGIIGVPIATMCTMFFGNILATIQYRKIVTNEATGIWSK